MDPRFRGDDDIRAVIPRIPHSSLPQSYFVIPAISHFVIPAISHFVIPATSHFVIPAISQFVIPANAGVHVATVKVKMDPRPD
jgi:hypothetical protein